MIDTMKHSDAWTENSALLYPALKKELRQAGCFDPVPWTNLRDMALVLSSYALGYTVLLLDSAVPYRLFALAVLTLATVHAGFIVHEAGHGIITRRRRLAQFIGHFFLTGLAGMSYDEFLYKHRRHQNGHDGRAVRAIGDNALGRCTRKHHSS